MATIRRMSAEDRKHRLLACAEELFAARGYRKTEVEEIVRAAGVTKPMLYRHFPGGKAEIFMAVLDRAVDKLLRKLWTAMASSTDPRERLHRGMEAYVEFAEEHADGFHLLVNASSELDPGVNDVLRDVRHQIAAGISNTITDVLKGAGLSTPGAPIYAYALLGGVESVILWWLEDKTLEKEALVDHLLAFVWRGFDGLPRDPARFHTQHPTVGGPSH